MNKKIIASLLTVGFLSGCSSFDSLNYKSNEFTGEHERTELSQKSLLGAVLIGGAASAATGGGAAIISAALIGTGVFGWSGLESDKDSEESLKYLRDNGLIVENGYKTIKISFSEDVTFDLQDTAIKPTFEPTLEGVAMILKELEDDATFEIRGHTDYTGPDKLNHYLAEERATVIAESLIEKGVKPSGFTDIKGVMSTDIKEYCIELSCMRRVEVLVHKNDILFKM